MKKPDPLTIFAILSLPFLLLLLPGRSAHIKEILVAAHVENVAVSLWPGLSTHDLAGLALPAFQILALSAFFQQPSRDQRHLRPLAAALWLTLFAAELLALWALPQWGPEFPVRFGVTLALILAHDFGGALALEKLICPVCCAIAKILQKLFRRTGLS